MINLLKRITAPHSNNIDLARQEFILNIILVSFSVLSGTAFCINLINKYIQHLTTAETPYVTGIIFFFTIFLLVLSHKGWAKVGANIITLMFLFLGMYSAYHWGVDATAGILIIVLAIVIGGILIGTRYAFVITLVAGAALLVITELEANGTLVASTSWKNDGVHIADTFVTVIILSIIAVLSWLSNREIERSLARAINSENELKKQRDQLEIMVEERTRELQASQAEKLAQLYRFAEFGKSTTGLFHDLATPLTLISLNLNKLKHAEISQASVKGAQEAIHRALLGTKRMEQFMSAAKKQIQNQQVTKHFSLVTEIQQVIHLFEHRSNKQNISILFNPKTHPRMYGNPLKIHQIVSNLLSNAIDAYDTKNRDNKRIEVRLNTIDNQVILEVEDWGKGIKEDELPKIFDSLYTTKSYTLGTGIGLSICHDIVTKDLNGRIVVSSQYGKGTTFTVMFPLSENN